VYAPSTLGSFLRAFTHGHVRQLQAVSREFLVQLARGTPLLPGAGAVTFIDVDSLLRRVYGKKKQGAGFGHAKVGGYRVLLRGLNALVATISTPDAAPVIAATRLRAGNTSSARGAASLAAEAITTTKAVLAAPPSPAVEIVLRGDSAFYSRTVIAACRRGEVRFSLTVRIDKKVKRNIEAIPDDAWVEIEYPQPIWDDEQQRFVSRAQIAETRYTAFEGTRDEVTARLIVRRIPDLTKTTVDDQGELFPVWRYHAAFTDSRFVLVQAEDQHRGHAVIEQIFAELIDGPLAHLPLRQVRRQQRLARPDRDRAQPNPRLRHPGRAPLRTGPTGHHPPAPGHRRRSRCPPRPRRHHPPTPTLALAATLASPVHRNARPTHTTIHMRHSATNAVNQITRHPRSGAGGDHAAGLARQSPQP
jgi:hypothetical protein